MRQSWFARAFRINCLRFLLSGGLLLIFAAVGWSQTLPPNAGRASEVDSPANPSHAAIGASGGAAMADFGSLMTLITETIEPDDWINGDSSLLPYAAGVSVNAKQKIDQDLRKQELSEPHDDQIFLSLKGIEQSLSDIRSGRTPLSEDICRLGDLAQILSVRIDVSNEDIVLGGIPGPNRNGYRLDDLVVIVAATHREGQEFGCSIDPTNDGIRAVQAYMSTSAGIRQLSRRPEAALKEIESRLGVQNVRLFGLPESSPLAHALVRADVHMKEVGFGRQSLHVPLPSYFDRLDSNSSSVESIVRWWFAYGDEPLRSNTQGDYFELPQNLVVLKSDREWMTAQGRASSGSPDLAAESFARDFSAKMTEIRQNYPIYDRLAAVYEVAVALQLGLSVNGQDNHRAWFPTLVRLGQNGWLDRQEQAPKVDRSLVEYTRLRSGTVVAVVSGGVVVESMRLASSHNHEIESRLDRLTQPSFKVGQWRFSTNGIPVTEAEKR